MLEPELAEARGYQREISIVAEARIAAGEGGATSMHDVTEGGAVTALLELAVAGGRAVRTDLDRIPVRGLTGRICTLLGVDPLGLIGSGALLFTCAAGSAGRIIERLSQAGIGAAVVGSVGAAAAPGEPPSIEAFREGRPAPLPVFEVDELARRLAAKAGPAATAPSR